MSRRSDDLVGARFGKLLVCERLGPNKAGKMLWLCRCECGGETRSVGSNLKAGGAQSCGCVGRKSASLRTTARSFKHGHSARGAWSSEYISWAAMRGRCKHPQTKSYKDYGGRGITVCERWESFEAFLSDMGLKPSPRHTIDRYPNVDGNYEPDNCRWATRSEQEANKRPRDNNICEASA